LKAEQKREAKAEMRQQSESLFD
jgi:CheY-like chemotaxis protein